MCLEYKPIIVFRVLERRKRLLIAMDAAFGMEYLHKKNVVHFDLKCENLLVNLRDLQRPICKVVFFDGLDSEAFVLFSKITTITICFYFIFFGGGGVV